MHSIKKEFNFCCAHRLPQHKGKCRFFHGHNYKVVVMLGSTGLTDNMVMDFSDLKRIVQSYLDANYDHRLVLWKGDPLLGVLRAALPTEQAENIIAFKEIPTAENMACRFKIDIQELLFNHSGVVVLGVEVFETPTASATWIDV